MALSANVPSPPPYEPVPPGYCDRDDAELEDVVGEEMETLPTYSDLYPIDKSPPTATHRPERRQRSTQDIRGYIRQLCLPVSIIVIILVCGIIPLSMIIMGSVYIHQCTIRPFIPIFLLVFGAVTLLMSLVHLIKMFVIRKMCGVSSNEGDSHRTNARRNSCEACTVVFLVSWFVLGSFYTFRTYMVWSTGGRLPCSSNDGLRDCCEPVIMYYALGVIGLLFGLTVSAILLGCSCMVILRRLARRTRPMLPSND